ncbi:MAG TPA: STAS domain-containing protein [Solirubrobacteraceae bacterium]|nr:STAS domain-containing protein [Solirubrobacteraceae bacterium]
MPLTPVSSRSAPDAEPAFGCTSGVSVRGAAWVCVAGELSLATAPRLEQTLSQAIGRARLVVVDLRGLTRVDAAGVGVLVSASRSARRDGRRLVLVRGLQQVDRLLALTAAANAVETIELATGEPTVLALLHIARRDRASGRARARPARSAGELPLPA